MEIFECVVVVDGFDNEANLVEYLTTDNSTGGFSREDIYLAGIVFNNPDSYTGANLPLNLSYTIR